MAKFSNAFGNRINVQSLFFVALCGITLQLSYAVYVCERVGNFECRITPKGSTNGTIVNTRQCLFLRNLDANDPKQSICNFSGSNTGCQVGCPKEQCLSVMMPNSNSTKLIRVSDKCGQVYLQFRFDRTQPGTTISTVAASQCSSLKYNRLVPQQ